VLLQDHCTLFRAVFHTFTKKEKGKEKEKEKELFPKLLFLGALLPIEAASGNFQKTLRFIDVNDVKTSNQQSNAEIHGVVFDFYVLSSPLLSSPLSSPLLSSPLLSSPSPLLCWYCCWKRREGEGRKRKFKALAKGACFLTLATVEVGTRLSISKFERENGVMMLLEVEIVDNIEDNSSKKRKRDDSSPSHIWSPSSSSSSSED